MVILDWCKIITGGLLEHVTPVDMGIFGKSTIVAFGALRVKLTMFQLTMYFKHEIIGIWQRFH